MAKMDPAKSQFRKDIEREIMSERASARRLVKKSQEEVNSLGKKARKSRKALRKAERHLATLQTTRAKIEKLRKQLAELEERVDTSDRALAAATEARNTAEERVRSIENLYGDALWRLDAARHDLKEVMLETEAERSLWWDPWEYDED